VNLSITHAAFPRGLAKRFHPITGFLPTVASTNVITLYDEKVLELSINLHTLSAVNSYADVGNPKD
jgi:hypothetical protein